MCMLESLGAPSEGSLWAGGTSTVLSRAVIPRRKHQVVNSETLCSPNGSPPGSRVLGGCWGQSSRPHTREALYSGLRLQPQLSVCEAGKARQRASPRLLFTAADSRTAWDLRTESSTGREKLSGSDREARVPVLSRHEARRRKQGQVLQGALKMKNWQKPT